MPNILAHERAPSLSSFQNYHVWYFYVEDTIAIYKIKYFINGHTNILTQSISDEEILNVF